MTSVSMRSSFSSSCSAMGRARSTSVEAFADPVLAEPHAAESAQEGGEIAIVRDALRFDHGRLEEDAGVLEPAAADERRGERGGRLEHGGRVTHLAADRDRLAQERLRRVRLHRVAGGPPGALEDRRSFGWIGRDEERLLEEADGALGRAEVEGAIGRADERQPGLDGDGVALGAVRSGLPGGDVVARERAGQLVLAERFEEAGGGQVAGAAIALGQRPVGHLADERLDEAVHARARASAGRSPG